MKENSTDSPLMVSSDYEIWGKLTEVYKLIGRARTLELSKIGLTPEQSHILRILSHGEGKATITYLAERTLKRHNSLSLLVKRMEKAGLVNREKIQHTNQYVITISEKGSELFNNMPVDSIEMIFSTLSSADKESLLRSLEQLDNQARHILGLDYIPPLLR